MPRVKNSKTSRARRKRILEHTKGFWGGNKNRLRNAQIILRRADAFAFRDRKARKRQYRSLWITRVNAAARLNGISYSGLISGLKAAEIEIDRKMLADLAVNDPRAFAELAAAAKSQKGIKVAA